MTFSPKTDYDIKADILPAREFHDYPEEFVVRPPYQRKNVWTKKKQQALLDSLFRHYYIPRLVLREVRLNHAKTVREVVDGQQRIVTAQRFFADQLALPDSLKDVDKTLPGSTYSQLPADLRRFADREIKYEVDVIKGVDDPKDPAHQKIATEIFWRLQQGESLNYMEVAHARLSSLARNFIVKYADDIAFDHQTYRPIDENLNKHPFFTLIRRNNNRMQHLALLGRLLMLEEAGTATDIRDVSIAEWIDKHQADDGVGNFSYEDSPAARSVLGTLSLFVEIFRSDPAVDEQSGLPELTIEYFIISMVTLLDHLRKNYALGTEHFETFRSFLYEFHSRWRERKEEDRDILVFADNRQQSAAELETRERVTRQFFFEYLKSNGVELLTLDTKRAFNEAERIRIYRRDQGLCQICLQKGLSPEESKVSWSQYQADHLIPWIKGGRTEEWNGQVLCSSHNAQKGAS